LADVLRAAIAAAPPHLPAHHWKILNVLLACRTPQLGGHRYRCEHCGLDHFVPRSCGNRHCPDCQGPQAIAWLSRQEALLLPVPYFHVVFTLPHDFNPVVPQNQRQLYTLLLATVAQTLLAFGRNNLGAQLGLTLVLHTWSQTLLDHYHVHAIVTGGGWKLNGSGWQGADPKFLFPVVALGQVFRAKFCEGLQRLFAKGQLQFHGQQRGLAVAAAFQALLRKATAKSWNVYAKAPFAGPDQVLHYLSRYTHRVAISSRRLLALDPANQTVTFAYKHRRPRGKDQWRSMALSLPEFLRRFCLHLLPERFVKIRHYGLLANRGRVERLARIKALLMPAAPAPAEASAPAAAEPTTGDLPERGEADQRLVCPRCGRRTLVWVETVYGSARGPPPRERMAA
jgi:hypothetical protein